MSERKKNTDIRSLIGKRLDRQITLTREELNVDDEARTVEIAFASDQPIEHWFGKLILDHTPSAIVLDRLSQGGPLLLDHDRTKQIGVHESISNDGHITRAVVRFSRSALGEEIFQDVKDGIRRGVSVGFIVHEMELDEKSDDEYVYRATKWEPVENSIVAIPADISVGVGRSMDDADEAREQDEQEKREERCAECDGAGCDVCNPAERQNDKDSDGEERRANNQPIELRTNKIMEEKDEMERFRELGEFYGQADMARSFHAEGKTVEEFKRAVHEKLKAEQAATPTGAHIDLSRKEQARYSIARAIMGSADGNLDGLELEVHQELEKQLPSNYKRAGGVLVFTRAGLDSATATKGAETKFTEAGDFISMLRNKAKIFSLGARLMAGLQGPVSFPKQTGAATAQWVGENPGADVADSTLTLGSVSLSPKTLQASTAYSRQLLVQSVVDVESLVREDLALIHALAIDLAAINGSGSGNQPTGILNTNGIGAVAIGANGGAPTYDHTVDLESAITAANADTVAMGYLTTTGIRGKLKKTPELGNTAGMPVWRGSEVNGYRAEATNQVPSTLTKGTSVGNCHAIIFGVFSELMVGEWGALELVVDPFRLKKQGMIEVTSFEMVDIAIRYAAAFAAAKDALTA
jgi:HK97 family phage major capsid protein